jgi:hypothetical protein
VVWNTAENIKTAWFLRAATQSTKQSKISSPSATNIKTGGFTVFLPKISEIAIAAVQKYRLRHAADLTSEC